LPFCLTSGAVVSVSVVWYDIGGSGGFIVRSPTISLCRLTATGGIIASKGSITFS